MDAAIRPRTNAERRAWLAGFAEAVNAVADHDLNYARTRLRTFGEAAEAFTTIRPTTEFSPECPKCGAAFKLLTAPGRGGAMTQPVEREAVCASEHVFEVTGGEFTPGSMTEPDRFVLEMGRRWNGIDWE